jgi:hypothetical protein
MSINPFIHLLTKMRMRLSKYERTAMPACDFQSLGSFKKLLVATKDMPLVEPYKIGGLSLPLIFGLGNVMRFARKYTDKKIVFDKQKFGCEMGEDIEIAITSCKEFGVEIIIVFPFVGLEAELEWIHQCHRHDMDLIIGGHMTVSKYTTSEGGYMNDDYVEEVYELAAKMGCNKFVVPGNKLRKTEHYINLIAKYVEEPEFVVPGHFEQNPLWPKSSGIKEFMEICPYSWHPVFGPADGVKNVGITAANVVKELYPDSIL